MPTETPALVKALGVIISSLASQAVNVGQLPRVVVLGAKMAKVCWAEVVAAYPASTNPPELQYAFLDLIAHQVSDYFRDIGDFTTLTSVFPLNSDSAWEDAARDVALLAIAEIPTGAAELSNP